ncbi:MAG: aldose 1-epimerase, partial [Clostridia bacterium]|nr:aldose 1-epimerase [Clostridia bacterium]
VSLDNPYLYGAPLLFPVNRISGGKFKFENREYVFPINEEKTNCHLHGVLHETPFNVDNFTKNSVVLSYTATKSKPYLQFLNEFKVTVKYKLLKSGIKIETKFKNLSNFNMPIMFGYHTTFNSKFKSDANPVVKASVSVEIEREMTNYLPTGKTPSFDEVSSSLNNGSFNPLSKPISRHYKCKNNGKIAIFDKNSNLTVLYKNSKNLNFRLIYNGDASEYICLEPQNVMANAINSPFNSDFAGVRYIKPNKTAVFKSQILLKKGNKL